MHALDLRPRPPLKSQSVKKGKLEGPGKARRIVVEPGDIERRAG